MTVIMKSIDLEIQSLLSIAIQIAKQAGKFLRLGIERTQQIKFQNDRDVKLQADEDSENFIRQVSPKATNFPIAGEEQGGDPGLLDRNEPYSVIDPLDGTGNYLRKFPICCVGIGPMQGIEPVLGVILDFSNHDTYSDIVGEYFYFNGKKTSPRWADKISNASLLTGFPCNCDLSTSELTDFFTNLQKFKKVRMKGSAAMAMTYVASGCADVYYEKSTNLWDIAGGIALIKAAGGRYAITNVGTKEPFSYDICISGNAEWIFS